MAQFTEVIFMFAFIITLLITIAKVYNIISGWSLYDWKGGLLLFIIYSMVWGIMFFMNILSVENNTVNVLFSFGNLFFLVNTLLLIVEAIKGIVSAQEGLTRKRYAPQDLKLGFK